MPCPHSCPCSCCLKGGCDVTPSKERGVVLAAIEYIRALHPVRNERVEEMEILRSAFDVDTGFRVVISFESAASQIWQEERIYKELIVDADGVIKSMRIKNI